MTRAIAPGSGQRNTVPEELARGLKAMAAEQDRSVSAQLRVAVAEHLRRAAEREDEA